MVVVVLGDKTPQRYNATLENTFTKFCNSSPSFSTFSISELHITADTHVSGLILGLVSCRPQIILLCWVAASLHPHVSLHALPCHPHAMREQSAVHCRRNLTAGQLFLSVEPFVGIADWDDAPDAVQGNLPIAALNRGADFLEAILSRPLYPFR